MLEQLSVAGCPPARDADNARHGTALRYSQADLTPGDHDVPPFSLGGQDMYAISPDGQEVAYTSNIDEVEATSTNNEIFVVPISGGTAKKISTSPGADTTPLYSPDGKYLAWRSQARAGFEADKWRLLVQDRQSGKTRDLTEKFDRSVGSFAWRTAECANCDMLFAAEDHGATPRFRRWIQSCVGTPRTPTFDRNAEARHSTLMIWRWVDDALFFHEAFSYCAERNLAALIFR